MLSTTFLSTKLLSVKYVLYIIRCQYEVTIDGKILPTFYRSLNEWNSLFEFSLLRVTTWLDDLLKRRGWNSESSSWFISRIIFCLFFLVPLFYFLFSFSYLEKSNYFLWNKNEFQRFRKKKKSIWFLEFIFALHVFPSIWWNKGFTEMQRFVPITSFIAHNSK